MFAFTSSTGCSSAREERYSKRVKCDSRSSEVKCDISEDLAVGDCAVNEVVVECVEEVSVDCDVDDISEQCDQSVQCDIDIGNKWSIDNLQTNPKMVKYYTGFESYDHFMMFFQILGAAAHDLNVKCNLLPPQDQLFLVMMKLRQAKEDVELSFMFRVSESTVSNFVNTWINFMYFQLKEINLWPSRSVVDEFMPTVFRRPTLRMGVKYAVTE